MYSLLIRMHFVLIVNAVLTIMGKYIDPFVVTDANSIVAYCGGIIQHSDVLYDTEGHRLVAGGSILWRYNKTVDHGFFSITFIQWRAVWGVAIVGDEFGAVANFALMKQKV